MADDARLRAARRFDDRVPTDTLVGWIRDAITGTEHAGQPVVVWEDRGAQVALHVGKLQVRTLPRALVVAIDTETEEFGVAPLVLRLAFGSGRDPAPLVASTDEDVQGDPRIAARWGPLFRSVVWAAIVRLSEAHAAERGQRARTISILGDHVRLTAESGVSLRALALEHRSRPPRPGPAGGEPGEDAPQ